jgi:hypothetical protein
VNITFEHEGNSITVQAEPREFSKGSCGFGVYGRVPLGNLMFQVSGNIVLVGTGPDSRAKYVPPADVESAIRAEAQLLASARAEREAEQEARLAERKTHKAK